MNIVFCAYAYKENYTTGHNIHVVDSQNVYLKNSYVALRSCRLYNPDVEIALVTNCKLSEYWISLFSQGNIKIIECKFDDFIFDKEYGWSLAFYKLCALKHILTLGYDNSLIVDTDTYTQRPLDDIWIECKHNILLYDISRGLYNSDYRIFCEEAKRYLSTTENLTRWGGEFIAGNRTYLLEFIEKCSNVYKRMISERIGTINGDEFIESIAAWMMRDKVKNARAYVFRYWTAFRWHYSCSNYRHNPVCILHCPREKNHGFLKIFRYMEKSGKIPNLNKIYHYLNLDFISFIKIELVNKILSLKN